MGIQLAARCSPCCGHRHSCSRLDQATAYKVGERKIRQLRQSASEQMGERFDLREFHRTILRCLGPLSAVEDCVAAFVAKTSGQDFEQDSSRVPEPEIASSSCRTEIGCCFCGQGCCDETCEFEQCQI